MEMENNNNQMRTVIIKDEALKKFQGGFTSVPNIILRNGKHSLGARMSYVMLLSYAWQDNFCFPAQERLAQDLGVTDRSVRTFLKELRANKLIDWKQQGLNRPNIYTILRLPEIDEKSLINQGPEIFSAPDRKYISGQDRKQASDYKDTVNNTKNVNVPFNATKRKNEPVKQAHNGKHGGYRVDFAKLNDTEANLFSRILEVCQDRENGANYLNVIRTNPENVLDMVISETRQAGREGRIKKTAGAYFMDTLKRITDAREQAKSP